MAFGIYFPNGGVNFFFLGVTGRGSWQHQMRKLGGRALPSHREVVGRSAVGVGPHLPQGGSEIRTQPSTPAFQSQQCCFNLENLH